MIGIPSLSNLQCDAEEPSQMLSSAIRVTDMLSTVPLATVYQSNKRQIVYNTEFD